MRFEICSDSLQCSLDQGVTESEGRRREGVQNGGVDLAVVLVVVAVGDGEDVELCHVVRAEDQGQPLVVGDVLCGGESTQCSHNEDSSSPDSRPPRSSWPPGRVSRRPSEG